MATADHSEVAKNLDTSTAVVLGCEALEFARRDVSSKHRELFQSEANERAISHVLACCLERHFTALTKDMIQPQVPWNIDCEYNRIWEKHQPKTQPLELLLGRLAILRQQKANAKNEQWYKYLSQFEDNVFDKIKNKLESNRDRRKLSSVEGKKDIVPDIILHQRTLNNPSNNAIAIEVKPAWGRRREILYDLVKLSALVVQKPGGSPTYQRGVFLHFDENGVLIPEHSWMFVLGAGDEPMVMP